MTMDTEELQKLMAEATQSEPTEWNALKAKAMARNAVDELSPALAAEVIRLRARDEAARKLAEKCAWIAVHAEGALPSTVGRVALDALAAWEAAQ